MTHRAIPAWHKGHYHQGQGKDKAVPGTQKGWKFEKRYWVKLEGLKEQLHLRKERTSGRIVGKTIGLDIMK
jgi:hypothetical protein